MPAVTAAPDAGKPARVFARNWPKLNVPLSLQARLARAAAGQAGPNGRPVAWSTLARQLLERAMDDTLGADTK